MTTGSRLDRRQLLEDAEPVEVRHAEVDQRHVERLGRGQPHALLAAGGEAHPVALAAERLGQQLARDLIVVRDQEHREGALTLRSGQRGGRRGTCCRAPHHPRSRSALVLAHDLGRDEQTEPGAAPGFLVEKNGSKMCLRSAGETPRPVSTMAISTSPSAGRARVVTSMRPPTGVASSRWSGG